MKIDLRSSLTIVRRAAYVEDACVALPAPDAAVPVFVVGVAEEVEEVEGEQLPLQVVDSLKQQNQEQVVRFAHVIARLYHWAFAA